MKHTEIADLNIPDSFPYKAVFLQGKPRHQKYDDFFMRHPKMSLGRRAKIFAPFAALRGYDEAIASKTVPYEPKMDLADDDLEEFNRRLCILHKVTRNSRMARDNAMHVTVTYFVPCTDPNHDVYGKLGLYKQTTGIYQNVTPGMNGTITVDQDRIKLKDVYRIDSPDGIFDDNFCGEY